VQLIKKYANRKLYHTNQKQYITLEGIAKLVEAGDSVQVLDNETGEDITTSTLAQVVLLARRGRSTILSTKLLTGLIQASGRLLRRESDRGTITILDQRLLTRSYGRAILDSLPPYPRQYI